jgi:hypothetical protein
MMISISIWPLVALLVVVTLTLFLLGVIVWNITANWKDG